MRLRGGFGTLCDPVHSGFIEVLHFGEWGSICTDQRQESRAEDNLVADVVCRQLGFPHGTRIDPLTARTPPPTPAEDEAPSPYNTNYDNYLGTEEAEEQVERFWLSNVGCSGPEGRLIDCDLRQGFQNDNAGCNSMPHRLHVACRQFPVVEALEAVTDPEAGAVREAFIRTYIQDIRLAPRAETHQQYYEQATHSGQAPTDQPYECRYLVHILFCRAEQGDLRLVDEGPIANWLTGLLQVFFEGSWSQVCGGRFDAADVNVACRQLGLGAGTIMPQLLSDADLIRMQSTPVFPEVAITASGCTGSEERLVDCGQEISTSSDEFFDNNFIRDCVYSRSAGLRIACVGTPEQGAIMQPCQYVKFQRRRKRMIWTAALSARIGVECTNVPSGVVYIGAFATTIKCRVHVQHLMQAPKGSSA